MAQNPLNLNQLQQHLDALNQDTEQEWSIIGGKLHKTFTFKNFIDAFGFMTRAAIHAEKINHHPEWSNVYSRVTVDLITHEAGGITELDFQLAKKMEALI
jgi:4a-hydroxytetrahydrobiopterin dehydratase